MDESEVIQIRKEKVINFLKKNYNLVSYIVLALITFIAVKIRLRNLPGLKDVTTGTWTLGPDLDPFLFLRWAKYIVENGSLMGMDMMRYVPLGLSTTKEYLLHPYMMAWFHKIAVLFGSESVTHSAVLYPVVMFGLTVVAFFLMARKIFEGMGRKESNVIALIASFFLSVIPVLLPRTIAGIPEKESAAFLFMFLAFYFFIAAWNDKNFKKGILFSALSAISTVCMANIWGGYAFIFLILAPAVFFSFILKGVGKKEFKIYSVWVILSMIVMTLSAQRYDLKNLLASTSTAPSIVIMFIIGFYFYVYVPFFGEKIKKTKFGKVPPRIMAIVWTVVVLGVLSSIIFGFDFIPGKIGGLVDNLVKPATSRLIQTVAENRQPYYVEWVQNFGPLVFGKIYLTFWLFLIGSVYIFFKIFKILTKSERRNATLAYVLLVISVVFSRYSESSALNGENFVSTALYALGFIVFIWVMGKYYYRYYQKGELGKFGKIKFNFIFLFVLLFFNIVAARGMIRLVMVLVIPVSLVLSYLIVGLYKDYSRLEKENKKKVYYLVSLIVVVCASAYAGWGFYQGINYQAEHYVPSVYTYQWQQAMSWVRENVPQDAVFGHWWDYGYWVQSIGERATVLDGSNAISYWNHLMGRHALTAPNEIDALEFLYSHGTTHFLIDSTDIGKYTAFSNIGSDVDYDRESYIIPITKDSNQMQEKKNSTIFVYPTGIGVDGDIIYEDEGGKIFLPRGQAGVGAILLERGNDEELVSQPHAIFVYQGQQYNLPLRYAYDNGELIDFGEGLDAGVFVFPSASQSGGNLNIDKHGALLYLSGRTVHSQLARVYLYEDEESAFRLVHSEDDFVVAQIKSQNSEFDSDFIYYQGFRGPIRIWEIDYPAGMVVNKDYLSTEYPEELVIGR